MRFKLLLATATLLCIASAPAFANQVVLEGSDATAFHQDGVYTGQLFTFMQNGSTLPVLVLGGVSLSGLSVGQAVFDSNADTYSLAGYTLSNYSAVYIESGGGCCTQADTSISAGDQAAIGAAEAAGLNVSIENYGGGPAWGAILPAAVDALPSSDFGGITDFGTVGGPGCTDGEVFNADGLSKGFIQPPVLDCYEHQAYKLADFSALGFVSLVNADPAFFGTDPTTGAPLGSALLALGGPLGTVGTPEPSSFLLLGFGLLGLFAFSKKGLSRLRNPA
jgi:hypothetical protein